MSPERIPQNGQNANLFASTFGSSGQYRRDMSCTHLSQAGIHAGRMFLLPPALPKVWGAPPIIGGDFWRHAPICGANKARKKMLGRQHLRGASNGGGHQRTGAQNGGAHPTMVTKNVGRATNLQGQFWGQAPNSAGRGSNYWGVFGALPQKTAGQ